MNILFVTWDGPQVSYLESLFLPIFRQLDAQGIRFHVLQFTWAEPARIDATSRLCRDAGVSYQAVRIWRRPVALGSFLTALYGAHVIRRVVREAGIDVLMPRSIFPALACLLVRLRNPIPMVFDADGLSLDERVDFGGLSPSGPVYRFLRDIESEAVRSAAQVLTRTQAASAILLARAGAGTSPTKFTVVGNGRDAAKFCPGSSESRVLTRARLGIPDSAPLLVYAGSVGPQYCLPQMLQLFQFVQLARADAKLLVLTGDPDIVQAELVNFQAVASDVILRSVPPNEVPGYLAAGDLGLALRESSFSMQGVAPIKLGEYLLCGIPVVAAKGIGNTDPLDAEAALLLDRFDSKELQRAADWFVCHVLPERESVRQACRLLGEQHFSLDASVDSYAAAISGIGH